MQLPLSHSLSLLSVGAKSHVSTASGCVDSFTNRNVKHHTQGGLRDKGELNRAGSRTNMAQGGTECHVKTPWLGYFNYILYAHVGIATNGIGGETLLHHTTETSYIAHFLCRVGIKCNTCKNRLVTWLR